ncbi:MAG: DUF3857 domain-containing protein [Microscillaceae bacterium]|jgi:hypothetical protein|nr:DUF3857 domain-containing protein [Microscillaceae bacterium]
MKTKITRLFWAIMGFFCLHPALAQEEKFGKIDPKWFAMKSYAADTGAAAVVLFDVGKTYFNYNEGRDLFLTHERHCRIKIFKKAGYEQANVQIPLFIGNSLNKEDLERIRAVCYNMEGGKVVETEINKKDIFEESITKNLKLKKFTIPGIKEGSIIEFSYRFNSDFISQLQEWKFQTDIPSLWNEYIADIPEFFDYQQFPLMQIPFYINKTEGSNMSIGTNIINGTKYRWAVKDAPAFKTEKYITTVDDYISKIEFQLRGTKFQGVYQTRIGSWAGVGKSLIEDEDFGKQLNKRGLIKEVVAELTAGINEPEKKMRKIYDYIKDNIKWNEYNTYYVKDNVKKVLDNKKGSSAEINFLLIAMLREAGIEEAYPVVLSTRKNGKLNPFFPRIDRLNYAVVYVKLGEKVWMLDATDPLLPMGMLPFKALNWQGKIIAEKGIAWIDLYPKTGESYGHVISLKFDAEGNLKGDITTQARDYAAHQLRTEIGDIPEKEEKYIAEKFKKYADKFKVHEYKIENLKDVYQPLKTTCKIEIENPLLGDRMYLEPYLIKAFAENPFKQEERSFPVDFGHPITESYMLMITLPEGIDIEEMPKSMTLMTPDKSASFTYTVGKAGNMLQLRSKLTIEKPVYEPEEYSQLRNFFMQLIAKQSEQIVLKKVQKP